MCFANKICFSFDLAALCETLFMLIEDCSKIEKVKVGMTYQLGVATISICHLSPTPLCCMKNLKQEEAGFDSSHQMKSPAKASATKGFRVNLIFAHMWHSTLQKLQQWSLEPPCYLRMCDVFP
jgi:hypothetical protein